MSKDKESRRKCFVCGRSPGKDPLTSLFRFPHPGKKNSLRCELWAKYVFPDKEYWSSEIHQKLYKEHRMLCNRHFKRTSFVDYPFAATKLHRFAVPDDDSVLGAENNILHVFPNPKKDFEKFNQWREVIGGPILTMDPKVVHEIRRVCHLHFEPHFHTRSKRVSPNAIPTLNLPRKYRIRCLIFLISDFY